ncbi:unnamed protein product [Allacma fusca]|uniref:Uncharacterized protein n=1 Tax=Allacma fusca TaxID=39272 RepID=A0A8J2KSH2_9HEXA|nr:unnamed protein product [Allacma fusca]
MSSTVVTLILALVIVSVTALPAQLSKNSLGGKGIKESIDSLMTRRSQTVYLSGYDDEDRPIAVIDVVRKWDAKPLLQKRERILDRVEASCRKNDIYALALNFVQKISRNENNVTRHITDELGILVDFDGIKIAQITSLSVLAFLANTWGSWRFFNSIANVNMQDTSL